MQLTLKIWCRAMWIYALLILPALLMPVIYLIALFLALCCGLLAIPVFALLLKGIRGLRPGSKSLGLFLVLCAGIACSFGSAFLACFWFYRGDAWGGFSDFYLFPMAAVVAGIIAIFTYHRSIFKHVNPDHHANAFPEMA